MSEQTRPRAFRRGRLVVVAVVVTLVAVAAGLGAYRWTGRARVLTTDGGLHVMVGERPTGVMMAAFQGRLTRVGRCIGLGGDLMIWPHGTRVVDGDRIRIGNRTYGLGDRFDGGGGVLERDPEDPGPLDVDAPPGCPVTDAVGVVNPPDW